MTKPIGVIDVGTNSIRLMLATISQTGELKVQQKTIRTVRTGEGVNQTKLLKKEAIERTVNGIAELCAIAKSWNEEAQIMAFATSCVRDAQNKGDLIQQLQEHCGIKLDVLSGDEEAQAGFVGVIPEGQSGGIIDIGGGSTEVIFGQKGVIEYERSFDIGCVRALDIFGNRGDFRAVRDWAQKLFCEIDVQKAKKYHFYTIGGTATSIAAICMGMEEYDASLVQDFVLTKGMVKEKLDLLLSIDLEKRKQITGMEEKRADIIQFGVAILYILMEDLGLEQITVSDADNLEGYAKIKACQ